MATIGAAGLAPASSAMHRLTSHRPAPSHQCKADERVLYACAFPRGVASLCAGRNSVHYRFGPQRRPAIDLASRPDWANVHSGYLRGQGDGHQSHVRISQGQFHYVIYEGMNGSLSESPGRTYSGVVVLEGEREVARLNCAGRATIALHDDLLERRALPEQADGPFDMWF
jgi:hypothetical protein